MKGLFRKIISLSLAMILTVSCFITVIADEPDVISPLKITVETNGDCFKLFGLAQVSVTIENISNADVEAIHADVIFDKLIPVRRNSVVSVDKAVLTPGEQISFSYKAIPNSSNRDLNMLQRFILCFMSLFMFKPLTDEPVLRFSAFTDETVPLSFGEIESEEIIRVWYAGEISDKDTDNDGLVDYWEQYYGTDKRSADTDKDNLTDLQEIKDLETDPFSVDTDGDGVSDYNEDFDEDSLSNGNEYKHGTDPKAYDSDMDGLSDAEEISQYKTNPIVEDTDNDGATDGWEVLNNFDPLTANDVFSVSESLGEVSEENPVVPAVDISLDGEDAESLSIEPVGIETNPLLSENIPGYLGSAYDFKTDGSFDRATLTFKYDASLGKLGDEFQPRIYYFNEAEGIFEELEEQVVTDTSVSANVTHFSTYILLNKVAFDKVWETEIKPPLAEGENSNDSIDIVFVIDYSYSMTWNDSTALRKTVTADFINKLREDSDKAAVVSFISTASVLCDLTSNKQDAIAAVNGIVDNDGYSSGAGTNGSAGINSALTVLSASTAANKYIVFLTDGEDTTTSFSYPLLVSAAASFGIKIYSVGLGTADEALMSSIAVGTGGKYYHASAGVDLSDIYDNIQSETIDLTSDMNQDGIPDYFNSLIFEGDLPLSNGSLEFMGIDFNYDAEGNVSDDYDGDGLKNGEELQLRMLGSAVYLKMYSDPMMVYSDSDKYSDGEEKARGINPLKSDYLAFDADWLCSDNNYYAANTVLDFDTDNGYRAFASFLSAFMLVWNPGELIRDEIINYFYAYSNNIDQLTVEYAKSSANSSIVSGIKTTKDVLSTIKKTTGKLADATAYLSKVREVAKYTAESKALISRINSLSPSYGTSGLVKVLDEKLLTLLNKISVIESSKTGSVQLKINGIAQKYQNFMKGPVGKTGLKVGTAISMGLDVVSGGVDIVDTIISFSKVNANTEAFKQNFDILCYLRDYDGRQFSVDAARSVINSMGAGYGSYGNELSKALAADTAELLGKLIFTIAAQNPYIKALKAILDGVALVTGIREDMVQLFKMIGVYDLTASTISLFNQSVTYNNGYYTTRNESSGATARYLIHIAQMRVVDEHRWCDYANWGGIIGWFTAEDTKDNKAAIDVKIANTKYYIKSLGLSTYVNIDSIY